MKHMPPLLQLSFSDMHVNYLDMLFQDFTLIYLLHSTYKHNAVTLGFQKFSIFNSPNFSKLS